MCKNGIYLQKYGFLFNAFSRVSKNVKNAVDLHIYSRTGCNLINTLYICIEIA